MLIDWFTVVAQALNFLILVWLMKRFLYKPILDAIDAREQRIAAELADAEAKRADAENERDLFHRRNEEFAQTRVALMAQAAGEAKAERERLFELVQKSAEALKAKRQEALLTDIRNLNEAISRRTQEEAIEIARKALADLAEESLEERMVDVFLHRLHELNGTEKEQLSRAIAAGNSPVTVRTAFDLTPEKRSKAENAIKEALGTNAQVRFEIAPRLISGIEIAANGHKVAWSVDVYLTSLAEGIAELLNGKDEPETREEPRTVPTRA
jgi:F-type H+-transporting ATPase subunit b